MSNIKKTELSNTEQTEIAKKTWVRNANPVTMSISESDPEKAKQKAEIFNKLYQLQSRRGIAKFDNAEEMQICITDYFEQCAEIGLRPTIRGLASTLGTTYTSLQEWENGSRDATLGSSCSLIIKKAKQFVAEYDEIMALEGLDNPILYMFRSKNYYGMKDAQEITFAPKNQLGDAVSPEEIQSKLSLVDNGSDADSNF